MPAAGEKSRIISRILLKKAAACGIIGYIYEKEAFFDGYGKKDMAHPL